MTEIKKQKHQKISEENNVGLSEKWSKCSSCEYNHYHNKSKDFKRGDYQLFNCHANIHNFPCERIPELYPEKLFEMMQVDNRVLSDDIEKEVNLYIVHFWDSINDNVICVVVASDDEQKIKDHFDKVTDNKKFNHLVMCKIKEIKNDFFENYSLFVVPRQSNRVVFPSLNIKLDHFGEDIEMEELVYNLERFPGDCEENCKDSHIKFNEDLTIKSSQQGKKNGKRKKQVF